ncbi:hypothetical protein A8M60_07285 [Nocardia farcinica]|nr:hypothetical protein A8M60_07285 [Nocardia farcinica]
MAEIPEWLAITQSAATIGGVIATTTGVVVALWVALSNAEKNREEREDRGRQLAMLQKAEDDRVAAQARRVIPAVSVASVFGPDMWTVKVANHSTAPVIELDVTVEATDAEGNVVPDGCKASQMGVQEAFRKAIEDAMAGGIDASLGRVALPTGALGGFGGVGGGRGGSLGSMLSKQAAPQVSSAVQEAITGQLTREWPNTLTPEQTAVMAFTTTSSNATGLRATMTFTDEAGYRWSRTDNETPRLVTDDNEAPAP